jgi:hypothetical protein
MNILNIFGTWKLLSSETWHQVADASEESVVPSAGSKSLLKVEAERFSETSVNISQTTRHHKSEVTTVITSSLSLVLGSRTIGYEYFYLLR